MSLDICISEHLQTIDILEHIVQTIAKQPSLKYNLQSASVKIKKYEKNVIPNIKIYSG